MLLFKITFLFHPSQLPASYSWVPKSVLILASGHIERCQVILHNILKQNYRLKVVRLQVSESSFTLFFFNPSLSRLCENLIKDDKFRSWWNGSYCHFIDIWWFQWIISVWINIETKGAEEHRGLTTITWIYLEEYHYSITKEILLAFSALNIAVVWRSIHPAQSHD